MFIIFHKMQEENEFLKSERRIRRRTIRHGDISKASANKNCPKFIVGNCWYLYHQEIIKMAQQNEVEHLQASFAKTQSWIDSGLRDKLSLAHLVHLFGEGESQEQKRRNYSNSRVFYRLLGRMALQIIVRNKKIEKPLSYLICLEKLTARLAHPLLVHKLQFK